MAAWQDAREPQLSKRDTLTSSMRPTEVGLAPRNVAFGGQEALPQRRKCMVLRVFAYFRIAAMLDQVREMENEVRRSGIDGVKIENSNQTT